MASVRPRLHLALYVAGDSPNSTLAVSNLRALCRDHLGDDCTVEVVDVLAEPERARAEGVLLTPMLVRTAPQPRRRVVGNLSDHAGVLAALGLGERA